MSDSKIATRNAPSAQANRLPVLAIKINAAHDAVKRHIKATIAEMMAAGDDLREAKRLAGHGHWLTWLRTNCPDISERTAHLYMQFAKWRSVVEDAMAKSATVADLEREQVKVPMGLAVGPFGVVDAIAAIHEAEHHENMVKENRLKLAAGQKPMQYPRDGTWSPSDLGLEIESFTNCVKCCLSRLGIDQHQRTEFLRQARCILDAIETQNQIDAIDSLNQDEALRPNGFTLGFETAAETVQNGKTETIETKTKPR